MWSAGALSLSIALKDCPNLAYLDINNNFVGDKGAGHFAGEIRLGNAFGLKELSLRNNNLSTNAGDHFFK